MICFRSLMNILITKLNTKLINGFVEILYCFRANLTDYARAMETCPKLCKNVFFNLKYFKYGIKVYVLKPLFVISPFKYAKCDSFKWWESAPSYSANAYV